ncbi:NAD-dependent epimerase/dehydratase family protein [Solwaraspora sp. WMMB335]|uniref:NAD-dependent epimerase/dehydratase family protein n=1 Tax=Solwaraspora sp. WMMB335 TaxID=3404118 RepID=UPI003B943C41
MVVHLAAAVGDPAPGPAAQAAYHAVNVAGTRRLLHAADDRPVVWVSSASAPSTAGRRRPGSGSRWTRVPWCCAPARCTDRGIRTCCRGCWPQCVGAGCRCPAPTSG